MRNASLLCLIAGCGFSSMPAPAGDDQGGGPGGVGSGSSSGSGNGSGRSDAQCDAKDATLRLCLTFDQTPTMVADALDPPHVLADSAGALPIVGILASAAKLDDKSRIRFMEDRDFDVAELTIDMWIAPQPMQQDKHYWLLDNNTQYYAVLDGDGTVRCGIGTSLSASSQAKITGTAWHHVACVYTADRELRVHVDGAVGGCAMGSIAIPTGGPDGVAIGANYGTGRFTENFSGGIDGVHVYARALTEAEICTAANRTGCNTECPMQDMHGRMQDQGPSDPGGAR